MKKKILILIMILCMAATIAPISLLALENTNNEENVAIDPAEGANHEQNPSEGSIESNNDPLLEEAEVKEESNKIEEENKKNDVIKDENKDLEWAKSNVLSNATSRSVNNKITSQLPSGDTLRYIVLTEDSVAKTGTVMLGWTSDQGPGASTSGNATATALTTPDLVLPKTIDNGGFTYTLTKIGDYSLASLGIKTLVIPNTVTELGDNCLRDNMIKELNIPEGVTTIGSGALNSTALNVVRFPSTITHLGSNVINGSNSTALRNIYFPVSNDITFTGTGNKPFYNLSTDKIAVICETKAQFDKWNKNTILFSSVNDQTVTYEINMEFYDRNGKLLSFEKPVKKLYGKPIAWEQNSEGTWDYKFVNLNDWGTIQDLPTLPSEDSLGYKANYWCLEALGFITVNKDGKIEVSNTQGATTRASIWGMRAMTNKMYAVEEKLEITLNATPEKAYDGQADLGFSLNRDSKVLSSFLEEFSDDYWLDCVVVEKSTLKYKSYSIMNNKFLTKLKNVADSGEYTMSILLRDDRITSTSYTWGTPFSLYSEANPIPASIKINPADIDFDFDVDDIIWNNQTSLPEITLNREDHGADGKIVWDLNQTPQKGSHSYNFTYIPSDATGIKATDKVTTANNYTASSKSGSVTINYKQYFDVSFIGINGNVIDTQSIEEGKSALAPTAPNVSGYKFVGWDKSFDNVLSALMINAIYEKLPDEKPSGGGTPVIPPVNRPVNPPVNTSNSEPVIAEEKEEDKDNRKNVVENEKEGIKIETSNKDKIFKSDAEVVVVDASKQEKKKAKQKLDDIIKVLEVVIKEDGVKVERTLDSKFKIYLDAKEYKNVKNLKVWQKTKDGDYKSLPYEIQDGQIVFECDALDTYVLTGKKEKVVIKENDDFPWWIIPLIVAGAGIAFYAYKKSNKESE